MGIAALLAWQWEGYARYHRSRANLLLHIVVVPLFVLANLALVTALCVGAWLIAVCGAGVMVASIAAQGRGHRGEALPPEPFSSPINAVARIFLEQWITFPRFVLSGGWSQALRAASAMPIRHDAR